MATWKITVKSTDRINVGGLGSIRLEKGMSVEFTNPNSWNPLDTDITREAVNLLFIRKYDIDLKKFGQLNKTVLNCEKIR